MKQFFGLMRYLPIGLLTLASCSDTLSYDAEMDRLIEQTGPGKLDGAEKAYTYCAEELKRDRVMPQSLYLGACSGLQIMIIQNVVEVGNPWKIEETFSQNQYIHSDFKKWRPFYVKMATPYVEEFCKNREDRLRCLAVLK
ncbi:MAG: hypothetical protein ACTHLU_11815 [Novosphingobium sp.]